MRVSTRPLLRARPPLRARPAFRAALPPPSSLPPYVDADAAAEIEEPAARAVLEALQRTPLQVPGVGTVAAAWVGNGVDAASSDGTNVKSERACVLKIKAAITPPTLKTIFFPPSPPRRLAPRL